jgi:hypothetical protein
MVLNRPRPPRCDRLLGDSPTRPAYDRGEYSAVVGRGRGEGLQRASHARGWNADVRWCRGRRTARAGPRWGRSCAASARRDALLYVFRTGPCRESAAQRRFGFARHGSA